MRTGPGNRDALVSWLLSVSAGPAADPVSEDLKLGSVDLMVLMLRILPEQVLKLLNEVLELLQVLVVKVSDPGLVCLGSKVQNRKLLVPVRSGILVVLSMNPFLDLSDMDWCLSRCHRWWEGPAGLLDQRAEPSVHQVVVQRRAR